jgi:tyrosinase
MNITSDRRRTIEFIVDRRKVLASVSLAALGLASWPHAVLPVSAAVPARIRSGSGGTVGKQALLSYRKGVEVMRQRSQVNPLDPTGWVYQALIHGIIFDVPKQQLIDGTFAQVPPTDPQRQLAEACWDTCPHTSPEFLPWHRIYVFYFERIVRAASGDSNFALPYWDYSNGAANTSIPIELREAVAGSPLGNALFDLARDPGMNGLFGQADSLQPGDVALDALKEPVFDATPDANGFSEAVRGTPHNLVHGAVGGANELDFGIHAGDMSATTTAGYDPIFWLHHSNIDRLWESWLRAGNETTASYKNRDWYNKKWTFVDETGSRQDVSLADIDAILAQEPVEYDRYENIPRDTPIAIAAAASRTVVKAAEKISVPSSGARVEIDLPQNSLMSATNEAPVNAARIILEDVVAQSELATTFDVYLNLAPGEPPNPDKRVGSFNFFGALHDGKPHPQRLVFDITGKVRSQKDAATLPEKPAITILPRQQFVAEPVRIGSMSLVFE